MKLYSLFLAAALLFDSALPAPITSTSGIQVRTAPSSARYSDSVVPSTDDKYYNNLERRTGVVSLAKGKGKAPSRSTSPAGRPKYDEEKKKEEVKKKKEKDVEDAKDNLAAAKEREKELKAAIDAKKKQKKEYTITSWKQEEIDRFIRGDFDYKRTPKGYMGPDGKGLVDLDEITEAFEQCMEDDTYLFWSSGGSKIFQNHAIPRYEKISKYIQLNQAVLTEKCKNLHLGSLRRSLLPSKFIEWKNGEVKRQLKPYTNVKWDPQAKARVKDQVDWAYGNIMSRAYARAASGVVHYVRPDRAEGEEGDFPTSTWARVELPELRKNKRQKGVWEVTMRKSGNMADYATMDITPDSKRKRL